MTIEATVKVERVIAGSKTMLWEIAKEYGGGITRKELRDYFSGVSEGYAVMLGDIKRVERPLSLTEVFAGMRAPQSFVYLTTEQFESIRTLTI